MDSLAKILEAARTGPGSSSLPPVDDMFESVASSVKEQMSEFDASHDFEHVLRVVALAYRIFAAEVGGQEEKRELDLTAVLLAA